MKKKKIGLVIGILLVIIGASIILIPEITGFFYEQSTEKRHEQFHQFELPADEFVDENTLAKMSDAEIKALKLFNLLKKENENLYKSGQSELKDPWSYSQPALDISEYGLKDDIIAYIRIPKMNVNLPIILGANRPNMLKGATHLTNTSYPIGGVNTNCVIAAHRGSRRPPTFKKIMLLEAGDKVYIENFRETLVYQVTDTKVIEADQVEDLLIQPDKDILTLFTCHPMYVYNQRYIVTCERCS